MLSNESKSTVVDLDCNCSEWEGCNCLPNMYEEFTHNVKENPEFSTDQSERKNGQCLCNDPRIVLRLTRAVNGFLRKRFRSKKWMNAIFGRKRKMCASKLRFKTRVLLLCNPKSHAKIM